MTTGERFHGGLVERAGSRSDRADTTTRRGWEATVTEHRAASLVAIVIAALERDNPQVPERETRAVASSLPRWYALSGDDLTFTAPSALRLGPPLGDGTARSTWVLSARTVAAAGRELATLGLGAVPTPSVLVVSAGPGAQTIVDPVVARTTILVGDVAAVEELGTELAAQLDRRRLAGSHDDVVLTRGSGPVAVAEAAIDRARPAATAQSAIVTDGSPGVAGLIILATRPGEARVFTPVESAPEHLSSGGALEEAVPGTRLAPTDVRRPPAAPSASVPPAEEVEIAILGSIESSGTDYPLGGHPKLTELVVYLAMHPEGALTRNWTAALWPDRRVSPQTVSNRLSEARRILGFASDGRPRLRRRGERHLLVEVRTDWTRFQLLSAPGSRAGAWRSALELVRGRPFDGIAQGQWTVFEGFAAEIERAVADVALRLGAVALDARDPELASWACQRALRACPFDERLHRLLMRAADAAGNRAGVEATLHQLALILEIDGDPLHGVHPQTAALYERLARHDAVPN